MLRRENASALHSRSKHSRDPSTTRPSATCTTHHRGAPLRMTGSAGLSVDGARYVDAIRTERFVTSATASERR
jgi:hypothetical protein